MSGKDRRRNQPIIVTMLSHINILFEFANQRSAIAATKGSVRNTIKGYQSVTIEIERERASRKDFNAWINLNIRINFSIWYFFASLD